ncbi:MAG: hypothetical protein HY747_03220, partial [Elusimicrobia bacterium]|nr:hypothetical protein [Elusimicrobiota bacterium]
MKRIFNLFVLAALVASFALAALVSTAEARGRKGPSSEDLLFRGIDLYEDGQMDEAMENFMEVIRMGAGSEETALAKEYINRISYRMAGKPIENKSGEIKQSSETAPAFDASPEPALSGLETSAEAQKSQVSLEVPAQGPAGVVPFENQKPKPVLPAPQALQEYVKLKLLAKRQGLIEELGKKKALSLVLKGTDKLLAVAVAEEALFSKETGFRSDIGGMLEALSKAVYYHPNHLIRIYP